MRSTDHFLLCVRPVVGNKCRVLSLRAAVVDRPILFEQKVGDMNSENNALDGLQQIRAMMSSNRKAPMIEKLGLDLVEIERGHAMFEGAPDRSVYNPLGGAHGGYAATLLDSTCGIAVHSQLGPRRGHSTLERRPPWLRRSLRNRPSIPRHAFFHRSRKRGIWSGIHSKPWTFSLSAAYSTEKKRGNIGISRASMAWISL